MAADKGLVEAACNLALLICRPSNELIINQSPDIVLGIPGVILHIHRWLTKAVEDSHPRAQLFRATIEQLKILKFR